MVMGVAFLLGATLLGVALVRRVGPLREILNHAEQVIWGVVVGWILTTFGAYLIARLQGKLSFRPLAIFTAAIWVVALTLLWHSLKRLRVNLSTTSFWRPEYNGLLLVLVLFTPFYLKLFFTHMLEPGAEGVYSGGSTWYDIGYHLALTTSFLYGQNFPPIYTPFPPASLLYPFLPDFQISVLVSLGMSVRAALLVISIAMALAITGLFYSFALRFTNLIEDKIPSRTFTTAHITSVLATVIFLLNGGFGFIYFYGDWRRSGKTLADFWSNLEINYANIGDRDIQWTNFMVDTMLPQRAGLFGFAVALIVFTLFAVVWQQWQTIKGKGDWLGWRLLLVAGVLTGLLPLFHTHIYVGIGLVSGFLFLLRPRWQWVVFWVPAVILALPHLTSVIGHVTSNSFMRFQPGWRGHGEAFWPWYWVRNIGLPALLIIPAWFAAPAIWRKFYLAFVCLLIFSLLVVITPNDYDNIKLIYLWYAPTSVLLAAWLVRLAVVHKQRLLAAVLALGCIASGLLALQYESVSRKLLYSYEEIAAANFARQQTAPRALFLTAPTVHQPILSLAGRPVLRADTAWLWSHGYEFADREADVKAIYAGNGEARELIEYYGVDYVYLGPRELQAGANQAFFDDHATPIYRSSNITIYDVRRSGLAETGKLPAAVSPREFAARLFRDPYQLLVEFPRTSYAVYRLNKTALGQRPRFEEFMSDLKLVGQGLYVGKEGWELVLEDNLDALAERWTERSTFKELYDDRSNEQYVDALLRNAGQASNAVVREALVEKLSKKSANRAFVLRRISETIDSRLDYNNAYVLVHYFGYLGRNPDDPPDNGMTGFNFWLNDLNRTGDYRSVSRVFIESGEYKDKTKKQ